MPGGGGGGGRDLPGGGGGGGRDLPGGGGGGGPPMDVGSFGFVVPGRVSGTRLGGGPTYVCVYICRCAFNTCYGERYPF